MRWVAVACALALLACVAARTATTQRAVAAHITSLTDKDAKRKAMEHPAFANAGRAAGTEIWRIENFEPVPVPAKDFGKFYKGDSYIVLKTSADKRNNLSWDIHYWLGSGTSQDEAGAAAILSVGLDDKFNGAAVQHREVMGHESPQFLGYFQPAIRYMDGGHASGFSHVTTNAGAEKRLFQIKGKRNVRVRQVDPLISSMNKGDVFILDKDQSILVYVGEKAKNVERLKAISVANQIRDQDHHGRGRVEIIDSYSSEVDVEKFFSALGSGSKELVPEESAGGDDQTFERSEEQSVTLSEISDASGKLKVTPLPKPYRQEQLKPQEAYILDTVSGSIYVWVGKQATDREKTEAMNKAQQYLTAKNYPSWVHVSRIPQGAEPATFKQYFSTWKDVGQTHSRLVRSASELSLYGSDIESSEPASQRAAARGGAARGFMPDRGDGASVVYRIENMALVPLSGTGLGHQPGQFYSGDSYVVDYSYTGDTGDASHVVYYWLGKDSTLDEKSAAAINAVIMDTKYNGSATIVRVPQGQEPKHFLKIFKGRVITLLGGKGSGFRRTNQRDSYDEDGVRLFRVHGTTVGEDMRTEQVPEQTSQLNSDDVFILQTKEKVFVWVGKESTPPEREEAEAIARSDVIGADRDVYVFQQEQTPEEFWTYLVGSPPASPPAGSWRGLLARRVAAPRLYAVVNYEAGRQRTEQLAHVTQNELHQDEVYLLDGGDVVFAWLGRDADSTQRGAAATLAQSLLNQSLQEKPVIFIKQGQEPARFTQLFPDWTDEHWQKHSDHYYEQMKQEALMNNEI